jgi:hypothetical protein
LPLAISLLSLGSAVFVASGHPLSALAAVSVVLVLFGLLLRHPQFGLYLLPAGLPLLNFSPWTGWLLVDEFDLLVLVVVAAGYFKLWRNHSGILNRGIFLLLLSLAALLVVRGATELTAQNLSWFSGYMTPMNSLRVGKSLLWLVLLSPLIAQSGELGRANAGGAGYFVSCLLGCGTVVAAAVWERAFYPGLLDISTPYRTVAMFWEMHLGGAALDAYLVLVAPLLVWAWRGTLSLRGRLALGVFVLLFVYVVLTTFSRGVIGAIAGSLFLLGVLLFLHRRRGAHAALAARLSNGAVLLLIVVEVLLVIGGDSFMNKRLAASERDFNGRLQHWQQGLGILETPLDWVFGIGLGRLPARLAAASDGPALAGAFHWRDGQAGAPGMLIDGPDRRHEAYDLGGLFALSQRVELVDGRRYRFALDVRGEAGVEIQASVCAMHLLYPARCQILDIRLRSDAWEHHESGLRGSAFKAGTWQRAGHGVFLLSVLNSGAGVEVANLALTAGGDQLLRNAQFLERESAWFPAAQAYFLPWHIDNLYLEALIETGLVGLLAFLAGIFLVVRRLLRACAQGDALAPYFVSSIAGLMALGMLVSVFDMPRVATLFGFFVVCGWRCAGSD